MEKQRISYIDFTKGVAIILVIYAHSLLFSDLTRAIIFSFHMPLFFICSGITSKTAYEKDRFIKQIGKLAKKIIIPALCVYFIYVLCELLNDLNQNLSWTFFKKKIVNLFFSLGQDEIIAGTKIGNIGMLWFLVAFFFTQIIYIFVRTFIAKKIQVIVFIALAIVGYVVGRVAILPLDIDIAMVMTIFIMSGFLYKKFIADKFKGLMVALSALFLWGITFFTIYFLKGHYLGISARSYPVFPISLLTALAATLFIIEIGKKVCKIKCIKIVNLIGKYSMILFLIHALDKYWSVLYNLTQNNYVNGLLRVFVDLIVLLIVLFVYNKTRECMTKNNEKNSNK